MRAGVLVLSALGLASSCSTTPLVSTTDGAAGSDGGAAEVAPPPPDAGPDDATAPEVPPACPPALASASELAATPRANTNLELLALKLSPGKLVADEATYQRVVRDVTAIRAAHAELAAISYFTYSDGRTLGLELPTATADQIEAGTYHAWDCLNATYGAKAPFEIIRLGSSPTAFLYLELEGIYAMDQLAKEYAKLPGVTGADGNAVGGDGPTICATGGPSTWHLVFDAASGDCPAGCIDHAFRHFTTEPDGAIAEVASWNSKSGTPRPVWVTELASPAKCH
jgi:hypothetical protein